MNKKTLFSALIGASLISTSLYADDWKKLGDLSSESVDFNLELEEPLKAVESMSKSTEPMQKHMDKGFKALNNALENLKADPNALNKANFEVQLAGFVNTMVKDVDDIITHKENIEFAFEDINAEVVRVIQGFDHKLKKAKLSHLKLQEEETTLLKGVKEKAREMQRKGDKRTKEEIREFKRLERQYKFAKNKARLQNALRKQYSKYMSVLGSTADAVNEGSKELNAVYAGLVDIRGMMKDMAEGRKEMIGVEQILTSGKIKETLSQINRIHTNLAKFGDLAEKMVDNMSSFTDLDPSDPATFENGNSSEDSWSKYLN